MSLLVCPLEALHRAWDNRLQPALIVEAGDVVTFSTIDAMDSLVPAPAWAMPRTSTQGVGVLPNIPAGHPLSGPIAIKGARPGDVLVVRVLEVHPHDWGWTRVGKNGLLAGEDDGPYQIYWDLRGDQAVPWLEDDRRTLPIRVPMQPFCGVMGVAPDETGERSTIPPRSVGGNLDIRSLVAGSVLLLPVAVEGALFSVGDVHAAQGHGEVCGTGIECRATVRVSFELRSDRILAAPEFLAPPAPVQGMSYGTTGISVDLMEAARLAVRRMIAYLRSEHHLSFSEAYILCSVAVDLSICEVVNPPNWVVTAQLPLNVVLPSPV